MIAMVPPDSLAARIRQRDLGVARCRQERYEDALEWLAGAFAEGVPDGREWAVAASWLAYCIARCQGRRDEAIKLCRHALKSHMFDSEIWHNMARLHLLAGNRRHAVETVRKGLSFTPDDTQLTRLRSELGQRRQPPLRFLPRGHVFNRILGRMRQRIAR